MISPDPKQDRVLAGIGLMLFGIFFFALNDALGKWLIATYSVGQLLLVRSAAGLVFLVPFIRREGWAAFRDAPRAVLYAGLAILAACALGNAWLGGYHAGVEWKFWQGPTDCSGPVVDLGSAGTLLQRLDTVKVIRCDEVQWRFLGLSLAGYNVLISLLMAAIAAWGLVRTSRSRS